MSGVGVGSTRSRLSRVVLSSVATWICYDGARTFALWSQREGADSRSVDTPGRRQVVGGLGAALAAAPVAPALAFERYSDPNLGYEFRYPTGLQKQDSNLYNVWFRDLVEPLESVGVKVTDTKRKSLDDIGDAKTVGKLLMEDSVPAKAPKELISATSKTDSQGRRYDVIEWRYQWKFDPESAAQAGKERFQLRQTALITIDRRKQYVLLTGAEEDRWASSQGKLDVAVETFRFLD